MALIWSVNLLSLAHGGEMNSDDQAVLKPSPNRDVVVVGAGIAGLSAGLEAARNGAIVTVIEMGSVFGGASILSGGNVSIVATSFQKQHGIQDTPELAFRDYVAWGEDVNQDWVRYYVNHSATEVYDWLTSLGVKFEGLSQPPGNSVPRGHTVPERGVGLVVPLFQASARHPRIRFEWNAKAKALVLENGQVTGLKIEELRTGSVRTIRAGAVVLATGGFQGNLAMVREFWPDPLPLPSRILTGTGIHSVGSGHEMARQAGAAFQNMTHQWNYALGLPDPRDPKGERGLYVKPETAIWVNAYGKRFVDESESPKVTFPALVKQTPAYYWAIFDEQGKKSIFVAGSDFSNFNAVNKLILQNPDLVKSSAKLADLATATGLPADTLVETITRFNSLIDQREDADFHRFSQKNRSGKVPPRLESPPFYAMQIFPLARKNMGGVRIDLAARVLDRGQQPIPGLFAAGELTGMGCINGKAALEGTFLGPAVATGRVAGRSAVAALKQQPRRAQTSDLLLAKSALATGSGKPKELLDQADSLKAAPGANQNLLMPSSAQTKPGALCVGCHEIGSLINQKRVGYWHFECSHRVVLERKYDCLRCHAELSPFQPQSHGMDRLAQAEICALCHLATE